MATLSASPVVEVRGLSCGHAGKVVLRDVELRMRRGSVTVLLGPNGSGKSTLLKTLATSLPPIGGTVTVLGKEIGGYSPRELARLVAYVPQEEEPQYAFTVAEAVIMGRLPYADAVFDSADDIEAAHSAMSRAGCLELENRSVLELSGGELQRVLVARALAQDPSLLLLDEPTSHLDVRHALELVRMLRELAETGVTILAAIHDLNLAARLADEAILLGDGRIQAAALIREVLQNEALDRIFDVRFERLQLGEHLLLAPTDIHR